jgi:hypothetical protein
MDITKNIFINGVNEWRQLCGGFNWYTFSFINIWIERDDMLGKSWEFGFVLLGLGFYIRYNTEEALKMFDIWEGK